MLSEGREHPISNSPSESLIPPALSQPVLRQAIVCNRRLTGGRSGFSRIRLCLRAPDLGGKIVESLRPDSGNEIPLLRRLSAETSSITTAARPWQSVW